MTRNGLWCVLGLLCTGGLACSGGSRPPPTTTPPGARVDLGAVNRAIDELVAAHHPEAASTTSLTSEQYEAIARDLATVPGVTSARWAHDPLGTVFLEVGPGTVIWQHLTDDSSVNLDVSGLVTSDPALAGWLPPVMPGASRSSAPARPLADEPGDNPWFDPYPTASIDPDPGFHADLSVPCPAEGRLAIVDFTHSEEVSLGSTEYDVAGVHLLERIAWIAEAAGFHVDLYDDAKIRASNVNQLAGYDVVLLHGHGHAPYDSPANGRRVAGLGTPEAWNPDEVLEDEAHTTYADAWEKGWIFNNGGKVSWTPTLLARVYRPARPQLWILGQCFAMVPAMPVGGEIWDLVNGRGTGPHAPVYNFGHALQDAGVQQVLGYVGTGHSGSHIPNWIRFFRRMFGAHSARDVPPPRFLLSYWPACMAAETFFRTEEHPDWHGVYRPRTEGDRVFVGYLQPKTDLGGGRPLYYRTACDVAEPHAMMRDHALRLGTPATTFRKCWDEHWSKGEYPTEIQDLVCSWGNDPTTLEETQAAACQVRIARQATLAGLAR